MGLAGEVCVTKTLETPVEGIKKGTIFAHKYDEGIEQFHKTIETDPNFLWARI